VERRRFPSGTKNPTQTPQNKTLGAQKSYQELRWSQKAATLPQLAGAQPAVILFRSISCLFKSRSRQMNSSAANSAEFIAVELENGVRDAFMLIEANSKQHLSHRCRFSALRISFCSFEQAELPELQ
jgi:hypothetical protein